MSTVRRLLRALLPYRGQLTLALLAMLTLALATGLYPILFDLLTTGLFKGRLEAAAVLAPKLDRLADLLARVGIGFDRAALLALIEHRLFLLLGAVVLIKAISQAVRFYAMGAVAQKVIRDLRAKLFGAIVRQSAAFFGDQASGFLISRVINDVAQIESAATYAIPTLIGDGLRVLVLASVCIWQYPELSLVSLVVVPFAGIPIVRFGKLLKRYANASNDALGGLTHRVAEMLGGIRVVQLYRRESHEAERFAGVAEGYLQTMMKSVAVRAIQTPIMELVGVAALVVTMAWAEWRIEAGEIRPGEIVAFLLALILLYEPIKAIGRVSGILIPGLAAAERVFELIDRPPEVEDRPGATPLLPMKRAVEIERVGFRYPGSLRSAVEDLELTLRPGRVVALVGPSGSGKSTVAALLTRLYDVSSGRIAIDGRDIRDATLESLRAQIAVVSQETYLFNDTLRANIAYGRLDATDAEIEAAAKAAYADEFIRALPEGYATNCGERGIQLSGGQRQRIAIARAFLKNAPILILDEATSALDNESEREVQRALDALLEHRSSLVIAHRLSTIRHADEIVVLEEGRVVERGTHDSLAAGSGAYFRLLRAASA
jgi:subfamily B ATP-binding cassette protein MsbA